MISDFKNYFCKVFASYLVLIFSKFSVYFSGSFDLHLFSYNFFSLEVKIMPCELHVLRLLKIVCFYMITFIFKVGYIIFLRWVTFVTYFCVSRTGVKENVEYIWQRNHRLILLVIPRVSNIRFRIDFEAPVKIRPSIRNA